MPQFVEYREDKTFQYITNNPDTIDISRGTLIRELMLRLQMTPTLTGANNTAVNLGWGGPWGVIKRLELVVNGSDTLVNLTGTDLTRMHYYFLGEPVLAQEISTLGDGATADPALDSHLIIPFWMPRSSKPLDTVLDARRLASLEMRVTWGTFTDVNSAATAWTQTPVLTLSSLRSSGGVPNDARFSEWRRFIVTADATVSNANLRVNLPTGQVYRGMFFNVFQATKDINSGNVINRIRVKSGPTVFADLSGQALRNWSRSRYGLRGDLSAFPIYGTTSAALNNDMRSWYYLDFVTDGRLREAVDTAQFSEFFVELDFTGAANRQIRILPQTLVPPRGA